MARIKITAYMQADAEVIDTEHESGLTQAGFEQVIRMLSGFDDVETELVDDDE